LAAWFECAKIAQYWLFANPQSAIHDPQSFMPLLLLRHPVPDTTFGLWQIAEDEAFFRTRLPLEPGEEADVAPLKGVRRLEWLAVRWLLHVLTGVPERVPLTKTAFAKPFFVGRPDWYCSLSHSHGTVGALLAPVNCGCDIQLRVDKMARLAPKFLGPAEAAFVERQPVEQQLDLQHIFWTAKESLYKAYGLKALDFRGDIFVEPFALEPEGRGHSTGRVEKDDVCQDYRLFFEKIELPEGRMLWWTVCL
jgi:4'-phosphopantetheinyl transferase